MAAYRISGVWLHPSTSEVTHYALHQVLERTILQAEKKAADEVIRLLDEEGNFAETWIWDYEKKTWTIGNVVEVGRSLKGKYLKCADMNNTTDHLIHLINYNWINF